MRFPRSATLAAALIAAWSASRPAGAAEMTGGNASAAAPPPSADEILRRVQPIGGADPARSERILSTWLDSIGRDHPDARRPDVLYALAMVKRHQGEYEEAAGLLEIARERQRRQESPHEFEGEILSLAGLVQIAMRRVDRGVDALEEALAILGASAGERALGTLYVQANLGLAHQYLREYAASDSILGDALAKARAAAADGVDVTHLQGTIVNYLSRNAEQSGRLDEAEELGQRVLADLLERVGPGHRDTIFAYECLGRIRAGRRDFEGAERLFTAAADGFDEARRRAGAGTKPASFKQTPYEYLALARLERGRFDEAWSALEHARGRLLAEDLVREPIPFDAVRVQASLEPDEALVGWLDFDLRNDMPRSWVWVLPATGPVRWERLPREETETIHDLSARLRRFRDRLATVSTGALGARSVPPDLTAEASRLWLERLAPILPHLRGARRIVAIPSGAMEGLPIEVLLAPDGVPAGERWAVSYAPSATVHAWNRARPGKDILRRALVVGDPPFREEHVGHAEPVLLASAGPPDTKILRDALGGDRDAIRQLPRLRWTREEARTIRNRLPSSEILLGESASEARLARLVATGVMADFDIVHLATHALVDEVRPERSALVLAQVGTAVDVRFDGLVTAEEIAESWRLDARLVTLSACATARGKYVFGEGTVGFIHPILHAGAHSVLASLWPVEDRATALLMQRFYERWLGGTSAGTAPAMDAAPALRDAKVWLRDYVAEDGSRPYRHPHYWSAFVLWR